MEYTLYFWYLLLALVSANIFGNVARRFGQPPVIGELIAGIILGTSVLNLIPNTQVIQFMAEVGAIVLLFEAGITSNLREFLKVGLWSFMVACVGVFLPFAFGYYVALFFGYAALQAVFIGAVLTATSVGITARVFRDLNKLHTNEARIILGAAVIDDVIGLAILAVVGRIVTCGAFSWGNVLQITGLAILFLAVCIFMGIKIFPVVFLWLKKFNDDSLIFTAAFAICLLFACASSLIGLAPIVGAFSAGLGLSLIENKVHIEQRTNALALIFIPIFFVVMGTMVDIKIFNPFLPANWITFKLVFALLGVAILGKILAGFSVLRRKIHHLVIGVGMIPRGEVGLIFASMGIMIKVIDLPLYTALVMVIILTTFVTPFLLKKML